MAIAVSNQTKELLGQPAFALIGNPTTAAGAGMVELDLCPRVSIQPRFFSQVMSNELNQMVADGVFRSLQGVRVSIQLRRAQAAIMAALFSDATVVVTDGIKFATELANPTPPTLCVVPRTSYGSGVASKYNFWVPAVNPVDISELVWKLEATDSAGEIYTVNFEGLLRRTDHNTAVMLAGYKMLFRDSPVNAITPASPALPWTLPSGY